MSQLNSLVSVNVLTVQNILELPKQVFASFEVVVYASKDYDQKYMVIQALICDH